MQTQAGYLAPCKIPSCNSCKACVCLLNRMSQHQRLPLGQWPSLQLGSCAWQLLMMPLREEMADKLLSSQTLRPPVHSFCQKPLIMVFRTPSAAGFRLSQLGWGIFHTVLKMDAIKYLVGQKNGSCSQGSGNTNGSWQSHFGQNQYDL